MTGGPIEPTLDEAKAIAQAAIDLAKDGSDFDTFPTPTQIQALSGIVNTLRGMQAIGWRIARPLKEVK